MNIFKKALLYWAGIVAVTYEETAKRIEARSKKAHEPHHKPAGA